MLYPRVHSYLIQNLISEKSFQKSHDSGEGMEESKNLIVHDGSEGGHIENFTVEVDGKKIGGFLDHSSGTIVIESNDGVDDMAKDTFLDHLKENFNSQKELKPEHIQVVDETMGAAAQAQRLETRTLPMSPSRGWFLSMAVAAMGHRGVFLPKMEGKPTRLRQPAKTKYQGTPRNNWCPCGSGSKFKKCCMRKSADAN